MTRRRNRSPARATLALALLLSCCTGAASDPASSPEAAAPPTAPRAPLPTRVAGPGVPGAFEPVACMFALPEGYVQGRNVDCGYLVVPEQRDRSDSRTIRLAVAIFHPEGGATRPDPVVYLSGGPGGSALETLRYDFEGAFGAVLATGRDVIVYDQRGVGRSEPALDCPGVESLGWEVADREIAGRALTPADITDLYVIAFDRCAAELREQADLTAYHSAASAADLVALRRALGYDELNLWAASYGTRLALTLMRDHPDGIRAVLLDSVYPPDVDLLTEGPGNAQRAFDRFFASCEANTVCSATYPDLRGTFDAVVAQLNADPATRPITNTWTGESVPAVLTGDSMVGLVFQVLYDSELRLALPRLIAGAHAGEFDELDVFRSALASRGSAMSVGMTYAVQCREEFAFSSEAAFAEALAAHPAFAGLYAIAGGMAFRVCESWGAGAAPPLENEPVRSDIPALLLSGAFDPVTPPRWATHAAETLSRATAYEIPWAGHGPSLSPGCAQDTWLAFLADPAQAPDNACAP